MKRKKILLTIADIIVLLLALYWVFWLLIYFDQTIHGSILITGKYNIFERNYLVPLQIFGITIASTVYSVIMYRRLRRKNVIGKKYLILVLFHIVPFLIISALQIDQMIYFRFIYA